MRRRGYEHVWHRAWSIGLVMVLTLVLHGCAVKHPVRGVSPEQEPIPRPAPIVRPESAPLPPPLPVPRLDQDVRSRSDFMPVPEEGKAAGNLLASARKSLRSGQLNQAEMILERALRVEPRNARLWHEMAQVKYSLKDYEQVVQLCKKSNSLAGKDYGLIQQNWQLMEKAYIEKGQPEQAQRARIKSG